MNRYNRYQAHPYHLVEPSPWPLATSLALLILTTSAVLNFQGWSTSAGFSIGFISLIATMCFWFRDCIRESSYKSLFQELILVYMLTICWNLRIPILYGWVINNWYIHFRCKNLINRTISRKREKTLFHRDYTLAITQNETDLNDFGPYLAGLIEGDGHFYIQSDENRKLNRKHNPQIVITPPTRRKIYHNNLFKNTHYL